MTNRASLKHTNAPICTHTHASFDINPSLDYIQIQRTSGWHSKSRSCCLLLAPSSQLTLCGICATVYGSSSLRETWIEAKRLESGDRNRKSCPQNCLRAFWLALVPAGSATALVVVVGCLKQPRSLLHE